MAVVQSITGISGGPTQAVTLPNPIVQGNLMVAIAYSGTAGAPPDTLAGWTKGVDILNSGLTPASGIFYKVAGASEPTTITWTFSAGTPVNVALTVLEYPNTYTVLDRVISNGGGVTSNTTGSTGTTPTTTASNELLIAAITVVTSGTSANTWTNSFTQTTASTRIFSADQLVSATGAYTTTNTWVTSRRWSGGIVTFKATPVTSTPTFITYCPPWRS